MSRDILSNEEFFSKLAELFDYRKGKDHGKIYLAQKRLSDAQDAPTATGPDPIPNLSPHQPFPILIRAHNGKSKERRASKVRLSTVLDPKDVDAFYARYAEVCKSGMTALKPRDRSRKKAKAKKKKGGVAA